MTVKRMDKNHKEIKGVMIDSYEFELHSAAYRR